MAPALDSPPLQMLLQVKKNQQLLSEVESLKETQQGSTVNGTAGAVDEIRLLRTQVEQLQEELDLQSKLKEVCLILILTTAHFLACWGQRR